MELGYKIMQAVGDGILLPATISDGLSQSQRIKIGKIMAIVCEEFGISYEALISRNRVMPIPTAKHILAAMIREQTKLPIMKIGEIVNLHHSTIIHACKIHKAMEDGFDLRYKAQLDKIKERIKDEI